MVRFARVGLTCFVMAILFTPAPAGAATGGWVASGPPGGAVNALAIGAGAPDRVWAGTVYTGYVEPKPGQASVSDNAGRTWRDVPDIRIRPIAAFAVDPTDPNVVYAGGNCNCLGMYKTTDGGRHWTLTALNHAFVNAIAIDPSDPQTLYVGTLQDGAIKSGDGGDTWTTVNAGLGDHAIFALAVDPFDGQTVFAGTKGHGPYRSTDGGTHWAPAREGIGEQKIGALVADPTTPGRLYAAGAGGVYRTTDDGTTWTSASEGLGGHGVGNLGMATGDPKRMYAGSEDGGWRTSDGGRHWVPFGSPLGTGAVKALAVDPTDDDVLYAGTNTGVMKSGDGGQTWELRTRRLSNSNVSALAVGGTGTGVLYAGERSQQGVFRSRDGGATWHRASEGLPANAFVYSIAVDPTDAETAYAGLEQGLYKTTDGGEHWDVLRHGLSRMVRVAPSDPLRVYATIYASGQVRLYRSEDGGMTWQDVSQGVINGFTVDVAIDPTDPNHLYAVQFWVYESNDGGDSWHLRSNGIPSDQFGSFGLAMDPSDPTLLYTVVGHDGYNPFRTSDGGAHWVPVGVTGCEESTPGILATDPAHPGVVYITGTTGVCRGTRGGRAWTQLPPIAAHYFRQGIGVAPDGRTVFVATVGGGVLRYSPTT